MIRVRVVLYYDVEAAELYPDGVPDPPRAYAERWPEDWTDDRRAAFRLNEEARTNPFELSSFMKDFVDCCSDSSMSAQVVPDP